MFVSGKIRGNAPQLADYLLTIGENERIYILDVDGIMHADAEYLKDTLHGMELNSELTRSKNSVYHAVLRPDPESQKDRALTLEEWQKAVEMLAEELPFEQQRRATVLHEKGGYYHAHVVFERYDHQKGIMIDPKHNYVAHDRARFKIEREFNHNITPQKNIKQPQYKKTLTEIWQQTKNSDEFIKEAKANGFTIAKGTSRPFMVIDENGRSFDLVRQLGGVKTKEVRERLSYAILADEKMELKKIASQKELKANTKNSNKINSEDFKLNHTDMCRPTNNQMKEMYRECIFRRN